jgi:hypothetical protein
MLRAPGRLVLVFACASAVPGVSQLWAQREAGRIAQIVENAGQNSWPALKPSTKVQVLRGVEAEWVNAVKDSGLYLRDRLRVERYVDVQFNVRRPTQRGKLIFLAELVQSDLRPVKVIPAGIELREARYQIRPDSQVQSDFEVGIEQGTLIVDLVHGRLAVDAAGTRAIIQGTQATVTAYPGGEAGFLFLQSGAVTFPGFTGVRVSPGDVVELRRGFPPQRATVPQQEPLFRRAVQYHTKGVGPRGAPFWKTAGFLLPAAAVVAGATIAITSSESGGGIEPPPDDGTRDGGVTITFP